MCAIVSVHVSEDNLEDLILSILWVPGEKLF